MSRQKIEIINRKKLCSVCKLDLPIEHFNKDKCSSSGLCSPCKECDRKREKEYRKLNNEKIKDYRKTNSEKINAYQKEYRKTNKEKLREYKHTNKENNREYKREYKNKNILHENFHSAKRRSKSKNLLFDLSLEWLQQRYTGYCELTGIKFQFATNGKSPIGPSLDRIDSSKGYTKDNVRIIIWALNMAFGEYGEDVYERITKAYWRIKGFELTKKELK